MSGWNSPARAALLVAFLAALGVTRTLRAADAPATEDPVQIAEKGVTQGALRIVEKGGGIVECPLKHTDVQADIAGFVARVKVTQTFHNPTKEKIEAIYVFPLPHESAVDAMTMVIGERKIVGAIKRRAEARTIYEAAVLAGQTAALLEQERPNIFTQTVGNIEPGQDVKIEISYVDVLRYDVGTYEFHFPMVVGPRYIPGTPSGNVPATPANLQGKVSPPVPDTDRVPDASRISPPVLKPGFRNGHDISLTVKLDAGVPIHNLLSANHEADITPTGDRVAAIKLSEADSVPNKDFVLRYGVVGKKPEMAVLAHTGDYSGDRRQLGNGYFMLMIQPKEDERLTKSPPREIVFLVDVSGSMSGEPTNKVIEAMQGMLKLCRPQDTLQVITFASQADKLFEKPVPATEDNKGKALGFTAGLRGSGGTEMLKGVKLAIDEPIDKERLRIVVMLTDGYIGNEAEIIEHVGKHCGDQVRFWCVGIGSAPNMFLVDGVAKQGGGMGKKLGLTDEALPLAQEIMTRIQRAQLAKIKIDWGDLKVSETYPAKIPELWAGRPVIVYGRYSGGGRIAGRNWQTQVTVHGNIEGEDVQWPLAVSVPQEEKEHDALAKVWARQKIEDLMQQSFYQGSPAVEEMVTGIALDYKLMSQYTSFVAVDDAKKAESSEPPKPPRRMLVPVPLPAGTQWEGFFGDRDGIDDLAEFSSKGVSVKRLAEQTRSYFAPISGKPALHKPDAPRLSPLAAPVAESAPAARTKFRAGATPGGLGGGGFGAAGMSLARGLSLGEGKDSGRGGRVLGFGYRRLQDSEATPQALFANVEALVAQDFDGETAELGFTAQALVPQGGKAVTAARAAFASATGKAAPTDREALRRLFAKAVMLDRAAANVGQSDGSVAAQALDRLEQLHAQDVKDWTEKLPALKSKLDLVLRDMSLAAALAEVGKAAKLDIKLQDGSVADAAAMVGPDAGRITYLDLRRATVAQALDWLLQPVRLSWRPDGKGLTATSDRRREGVFAWTYDVSPIALPNSEDLVKLNDYPKSVAEASRAADEFLAAVRKQLKIEDEAAIVWLAPGQLLVFGSPERHAAVARLIDTLQQGQTRPEGPLAALSDITRKRFTARKEKLAKIEAAERKLAVAAAHDQFSWQLLAAATGGDLDLEALTELQIAWKAPQNAELLTGPARPLVLRSLWSICEASRTLPAQKELAALAATARQHSAAAAEAAVAAVEKDRKDTAAAAAMLYATLANPDDSQYRTKAVKLLAENVTDHAPSAELRTLGRVLVGQPTDADRQALVDRLAGGTAGADHTLLAALACRRAGGEVWSQFRAASRDVLGGQPLPGELVVFINRLAK